MFFAGLKSLGKNSVLDENVRSGREVHEFGGGHVKGQLDSG